MPERNARERIVNLLDREVFQPILEASPDRYESEADRERLKKVQAATRRTQERYRKEYTSAREVCEMFRSDLTSDEAKEVERDLRYLDLPTLRDIEERVENLCREAGAEG